MEYETRDGKKFMDALKQDLESADVHPYHSERVVELIAAIEGISLEKAGEYRFAEQKKCHTTEGIKALSQESGELAGAPQKELEKTLEPECICEMDKLIAKMDEDIRNIKSTIKNLEKKYSY